MRRIKKCLASLMAACLLLGLAVLPASGAAADYPDLPPAGVWSHDALTAAVDNGLLRGTDGKLLPDGLLTRSQMAAVINRAFGAVEKAGLSGYTDVAAGAWYREDMALAVGMKTLSGDGAGRLSPEALATREAVFTVLARAIRLPNGDGAALAGYADASQVSSWARGPVAAMVAGGYVQGSGNLLNPQGNMTRAEYAQVLYNLLGGYIGAAGVYTEIPEGNVMVNVPGVTLKGVTVAGDLIVGDGVADGDLVLDGVTVQGRLVVRGGGGHSIRIVNKSSVGSVVVGKTSSGGVRVLAERGCRVELVQVDDGKDDVILEGAFNAVAVESAVPVVLQDAVVTELAVKAAGAEVSLEGKSTVATARVEEKAEGAALTVARESVVAKVESAAPKAAITGEGKVTEAVVSGSGTKVDTAGTTLTVDKNATGVTAGDKAVSGGTTTVTAPKEDNKPSGGGSSGPSYYTATVNDADGFIAAAEDAYCNGMVVDGIFTLSEYNAELTKPLTVNTGKNLTLNHGAALFLSGNTLTVNGALTLGEGGYLRLGSVWDAAGVTLVNKGTISIAANGELEVSPFCTVAEQGTVAVADGGILNGVDVYPMGGEEAPQTCPGLTTGYTRYSAMANVMAGIKKAVGTEIGSKAKYSSYYLFHNYSEEGRWTVELTEDFSIPAGARFYVTDNIILPIPSGRTFTIPSGAHLDIAGTMEIQSGGKLINNGTYRLASIGKLINDGTIEGSGTHSAAYTVHDQAEWEKAAADIANCTLIVVDAGQNTIEVKNNLTKSGQYQLFINSGTLTVPNSVTLTLTDWAEVREGGTLTVEKGGALVLSAVTDGLTSGLKVDGALNNAGTLTVGAEGGLLIFGDGALSNTGTLTLSSPDAYLGLDGHMENGGALAIQANAGMDINEGGVLHNSGAVSLAAGDEDGGNRGFLFLKNGSITGTKIDGIEIVDRYDDQTRTPGQFPHGTAYGDYRAEVWTEAGLKAAMASNKDYTHCEVGRDWSEDGSPMPTTLILSSPTTLEKPLDVGAGVTLTANGNLTVEKHLGVSDGGKLVLGANANLLLTTEGCDLYIGPDGTLDADGMVTVGDSENHANVRVEGTGALTLTGRLDIAQESSLEVCGGTLALKGTAVLKNNGYFGLLRGAALTKSEGAAIHNADYMQVVDEYGPDSGNKTVSLPAGKFFTNDSNWYEHNAYIYSGAGMTAAFESGTVYDYYHLRADITLNSNLELKGRQLRIDRTDYDPEMNGDAPVTLTVPQNLTLTLNSGKFTPRGGNEYDRGGLIEVNGGGSALVVNGTLNFDGPDDTVIVWEGSSLSGAGTITPNAEEENHNPTPICARDMMNGNGSANEDAKAAVAEKFNTLVRREALAVSGADFAAANEANSGYDAIIILNDKTCDLNDLTEKAALTLNRDVEIYWGGKLVIPEGMTFTIAEDHYFYLAGDLWVNGALVNRGSFNQDGEGNISGSGTLTNTEGGIVEGAFSPDQWTGLPERALATGF
ncbi:S-layer homology domain-containing protein [Lawsonibacter faecis]|uniref:S-layer homology domain-containing protein n=1 Tax=Lawsonibacter faecis TaxID=2763052 RepID=A0A8J6MGN4_9FIRM|nr:S-layer homology domain-containing protein [Lawsonibacter faecis]MBC5737103.1 S-layer homology domain-containing protein [Lawsonibacter faecis]